MNDVGFQIISTKWSKRSQLSLINHTANSLEVGFPFKNSNFSLDKGCAVKIFTNALYAKLPVTLL